MKKLIAALIVAASPLAVGQAHAWQGEVVDNTFTGCVGRSGLVRKLQRGDEPKRRCGRFETQVGFAETPLSSGERPNGELQVRAVSWDLKLGHNETFSPAPGIEMVCEDIAVGIAFTITINDTVFAYMETQSSGRSRYFVYQETMIDQEWQGGPFLTRASGIGNTTSASLPLPCSSEGFAEFFESS